MPTHIFLNGEECGLNQDSIVLLEQIRTIDKSRLGAKIGSVPTQVLKAVDYALQISLGVSNNSPGAVWDGAGTHCSARGAAKRAAPLLAKNGW